MAIAFTRAHANVSRTLKGRHQENMQIRLHREDILAMLTERIRMAGRTGCLPGTTDMLRMLEALRDGKMIIVRLVDRAPGNLERQLKDEHEQKKTAPQS